MESSISGGRYGFSDIAVAPDRRQRTRFDAGLGFLLGSTRNHQLVASQLNSTSLRIERNPTEWGGFNSLGIGIWY